MRAERKQAELALYFPSIFLDPVWWSVHFRSDPKLPSRGKTPVKLMEYLPNMYKAVGSIPSTT